jgi:hypothetical protein
MAEYYQLPGRIFRSRTTQLQQIRGTNENVTLQTDYAKPLSPNSKIEMGARRSSAPLIARIL